jgi:hypothetical protein
MSAAPAGPWLRTPAAAEYCGLAPATLETLRTRGGGPIFTRAGKAVVYCRADLDAWLAAGRASNTAQADAAQVVA